MKENYFLIIYLNELYTNIGHINNLGHTGLNAIKIVFNEYLNNEFQVLCIGFYYVANDV